MPIDKEVGECSNCGNKAKRIISCSGQNCGNEDAEWIRSVLEVVDHSSNEKHTREFIKNPTRSNYKAWMKGEGLRHMEPGEEKVRRREPDMSGVHRDLMRRVMEGRRIEI